MNKKELLELLIDISKENNIKYIYDLNKYLKDNYIMLDEYFVIEELRKNANLQQEITNEMIEYYTNESIIESANEKFIPDKLGRMYAFDYWLERAYKYSLNFDLLDYQENLWNENDIDLVVVSSVPDPSPLCIERQGKIYAVGDKKFKNYKPLNPELYKNGGGLLHYNCRHSINAYEPGFSEPPEQSGLTKLEEQKLYEKRKRYMSLTNQKYKLEQQLALNTNEEEQKKIKNRIKKINEKLEKNNFDNNLL